jgi:sugar (pentulose or hexulose) kinase
MFLERLDFYTVWGFTMARLGGGAHSAAWAQMFADALDMPIGEPAGEEMGT